MQVKQIVIKIYVDNTISIQSLFLNSTIADQKMQHQRAYNRTDEL